MPETGEGDLRPGSTTAGQWIRRSAVTVMLLFMAATFWARLGLPGATGLAEAVLTAAPAAVAVVLIYFYLAWVPALAKLLWALKNRSGTPAEYRAYRQAADAAALGRARTGFGRWAVGLREGTW